MVCEAFDWEHGVFKASTNGSETTTAAIGQVGIVRRDPMAMLPFTGYNMADYFSHWLSIGKRLSNPPKIFSVNWFKKDTAGRFVWPGFRENSRVVKWIVDRVKDRVPARETPIGLLPRIQDMDLEGLSLPREAMESLFEIDAEQWKREIEEVEGFYARFGERLPAELRAHFERLRASLAK